VRAARSAGLKEIPIVVKTDWDEDKAKVETVRRNVLRGEMDKAKFTDLVNDVVANTNSPVEDIIRKMALTEEEFRNWYIARADIQSKLLEDVKMPKEKALYEDVTYIVQKIMEENKDNIDKGYVYFMFKGALVCCVEMDREDKNRLYELLTNSQERGKNLNKLLVERILGPKSNGKTKNTD
jgi:Glu-tRNA(Gln) amidotransferase subunit E-like FAD-binding protein